MLDFNGEKIKRGDIYYANISDGIGSEQKGMRPVVIIQNNTGNQYSTTTIVAMVTSKWKRPMPTHVKFGLKEKCGLERLSTILLEQIRVIDKSRLIEKVGSLPCYKIVEMNEALKVSLGLK